MTSAPVYAKLRAEIDSGITKGIISSPITSAEAAELPYLDSCIREGLRIFPPFAGLNVKKVSGQGEKIKGRFIPGGTGIAVQIWGIQRNEVFGQDVEIFRPERWLEADKQQRTHMIKVNDLVFGYGRWLCLGKKLVSTELRQALVEVRDAEDAASRWSRDD